MKTKDDTTLFRIHWFAVTVHVPTNIGMKLWQAWFEEYLGKLTPAGHGGRGFKTLYSSLGKAKLYGDPAVIPDDDYDNHYIHIEIPGDACDAIPNETFQNFITSMKMNERFKVTRIDLAWDGVCFSPEEVKEAIQHENIRSLVKRRTMVFSTSAFEMKDNGDEGTSSLRLGSRYSSRMLRAYDKRGPVRLEFQLKDKRAHTVTQSIMSEDIKYWSQLGVSHLRDYIDFVDHETGKLLPWWEEFVSENARARLTISDARKLELDRMVEWIDRQVSTTLSVLNDVFGEELITELIDKGREKRGKKFDSLLYKPLAEETDDIGRILNAS